MHSSIPDIPGAEVEPYVAQDRRREVKELLGRSAMNFPGAQPVSFARHHLQELNSRNYYICEKSDGVRCLLYCTRDDDGLEMHYLIDRKNNYYAITGLHLPLPNDPSPYHSHNRSILDGEFVYDTLEDGRTELRYLVFDCLVLDGKVLVTRNYDSRIGHFKNLVWDPYQKLLKKDPKLRSKEPFHIQWKMMERAYGLDKLFRSLSVLPHGTDGLVFTCQDTPYKFGTDECILKWKPAHENSLDFRLTLGNFPLLRDIDGEEPVEDYDAMPTFDLEISYGEGNYRPFASLFITNDEWESMKSLNQQLDGRLIECWRDQKGRWRYKHESDGTPRFRDDKLEPNHISTVNKVLESIEDAVSEDDLLASVRSIKENWDHRHAEEARKRIAPSQSSQHPELKKARSDGYN